MVHYQTQKEQDRFWLMETEFAPDFEQKTESAFAQCNGYMGVRAAHPFRLVEEKRGLFISGVFHKAYEEEVTELVNCPDIVWMEIEADGRKLFPERGGLLEFKRKLDMLSGELALEYVFRLGDGKKLLVECRRFASKDNIHLFLQSVKIQVLEGSVSEVKIRTGIDGQQTNSGVSHFHSVKARVYEREIMELAGELAQNTVRIAAGVTVRRGTLKKKDFSLVRRKIQGDYVIAPDESGQILLEKISFINLADEGTDAGKKMEMLSLAAEAGYPQMFASHRGRMDAFWEHSRVQIEGITEEEEAAICFALYHIQGMTPWHTSESSIAAKGLTGEGYKGHVFWDTEIFLLPSLLYTFPEAARRLLEFRHRGLEGARKKARAYGFKGAMFPWEAAGTGEEETPLYAALNIYTGKAGKVWSGIKEYHVTADIIYAVDQYYKVTGDQDFMEKCGYEMTFEAARFWVSLAELDKAADRYVICDVIGPDEYTEHVDNNAYTNYMAGYCVETACRYADDLREEWPELYWRLDGQIHMDCERKQWKEFLEKLYLPEPNQDGILPQDDTFLAKPCLEHIEKYRNARQKQSVLLDYSREEIVNMQVLKQADAVMLMNLFPRLFPEEIVKKNVLFYEKRTIHDSSLSYCAHAQACAAIGAIELADEFFGHCLMIDLDDNPYDSMDGIHSASLGGIWNCLIFGFAGVSCDGGHIYLEPHLPKHWRKMKFQLMIYGMRIVFEISGQSVRLACERMIRPELKVWVRGKEYAFRGELKIKLDHKDD